MDDISEVKIECFGPHAAMAPITRALAAAGFGRVGRYDHCFAISTVSGSFRPLTGANPHTGEIGRVRQGMEGKLEFNCAAQQAAQAVAVIRAAHPYEEPVINVVPLWNGRYGATG